jgi:O-antigen/teichoic acid export membrane protein
MQKTPLRPLRLQQLIPQKSPEGKHADQELKEEQVKPSETRDAGHKKSGHDGWQEQEHENGILKSITTMPAKPEKLENQMRKMTAKQVYSKQMNPMLPDLSKAEAPPSTTDAHHLLKRTPNNYVYNQVYGLWFYISSFLFTIVVTRNLGPGQYGTYSIVQTALNTLLYIVALGLEDAVATFVPRTLAENGEGAAAQLTRYLLYFRAVVLATSVAIILFGLPVLAALFNMIPLASAHSIAVGMSNPVLREYSIPIALYVLGSGVSNLLGALCAAQMRSYIVLIAGSAVQLVLLAMGFVLLRLGWGVTGILWLQAVVALLYGVTFVIWQAPFLRITLRTYQPPVKDIFRLSLSAWITNLASGALLKQVSIILLGIFAISVTQIGYFNLSFQLADAANSLLVAGFMGVGGSALSAAFAGNNHDRLGKTWQALIKIETLLEAPALVFCLFNAENIVHVLYGSKYDAVGPLLTIFLFFNLLVRLFGATIHQYGLYVIGKARWVVLSQWIGILVTIAIGIVLIPRMGAAGALLADGCAKAITALLLLLFILRTIPTHYAKEVLFFTLRILLALVVAALPWLIWHPGDRLMLGLSGVIFIVLCVGLLLLIKPLSKKDMEMLGTLNARLARYLHYFSRT